MLHLHCTFAIKKVSWDLKVIAIEEFEKSTDKWADIIFKYKNFMESNDIVNKNGEFVEYCYNITFEDRNGKTVRCYNEFNKVHGVSIWNYKNLIIGKIVHIDGMYVTEHGIIREPRYGGIRFDKKIADAIE